MASIACVVLDHDVRAILDRDTIILQMNLVPVIDKGRTKGGSHLIHDGAILDCQIRPGNVKPISVMTGCFPPALRVRGIALGCENQTIVCKHCLGTYGQSSIVTAEITRGPGFATRTACAGELTTFVLAKVPDISILCGHISGRALRYP